MAGGVFKISCPFCVTTTVMSDSACPRCGNGPETRKVEAERIAFKKAFKKKQQAVVKKSVAKVVGTHIKKAVKKASKKK